MFEQPLFFLANFYNVSQNPLNCSVVIVSSGCRFIALLTQLKVWCAVLVHGLKWQVISNPPVSLILKLSLVVVITSEYFCRFQSRLSMLCIMLVYLSWIQWGFISDFKDNPNLWTLWSPSLTFNRTQSVKNHLQFRHSGGVLRFTVFKTTSSYKAFFYFHWHSLRVVSSWL